MKRSTPILALALAVAFGCADADSPRGFSLPAGDAARGQATFVELHCHSCHTVDGVELPAPTGEPPIHVRLGGETTRVKTYGELVTSIIDPSHRLAPFHPLEEIAAPDGTSRMTVYNDVMTVTQLVDLVTFLESRYRLRPYAPTDYPVLP
ncbi:MAG TPA: c-type cytochrome [Thermoanaerobaculia bacterium]|nr:c-type cytochrome [Thermoanaerobaculia bacterium]